MDLFRVVCERDLEGIVAKHAQSPYRDLPRSWLKVINADCSQLRDRHELFERRVLRAGPASRPRANAAAQEAAAVAPRAVEKPEPVERKRRAPAKATLKTEHVGRRARRKK